jgi:phosphatidylglycerophosphate synthase
MRRTLIDSLPVLVLGAYFVVGFAAYLVRCAVKGVPRDREMEARGGSAILGLQLRHYFVWIVSPFWRLLLATGVRADTVTLAAALLGGGGSLAMALGRFALGGCLSLASGILDAMDGRLARFRRQASQAGAAFDSVLDRYVDFALLAGLGWYYRGTLALLTVLLAMLGSFVVPYVRAKGEALRVPVANGLMQRPERLIILGGSVALSPLVESLLAPRAGWPPNWLAVVGIAFVAVASNLTAITRFRALVRGVRTPRAAVPFVEASANVR